MGTGNYDNEAYEAITSARVNLPTEQIFTRAECHPDMNPQGVATRESRDSQFHPESNAIIFALDVSGSMGNIPGDLSRGELPTFMQLIIDGQFIKDPQLMFMAVFDANAMASGGRIALQVGQFESEASLMDKWLTNMFLTGGGGPVNGESYDLAFYFAARHTSIDCWEKRQRKGYLILTGDEPHFGGTTREHARISCGDQLGADLDMQAVVNEASEKYHCFFLLPDTHRRQYEDHWRALLGDRVIAMESHEDTCLVSATLIGLTEGTLADLDAAAALLTRLGRQANQVNRVIRAVEPYAALLGRGGPARPTDPATVPGRRRRRT